MVPDRSSLQELDKLCTMVDGRPRIVADPPLVVPVSDLVADQAETGELAAAMSVLISRYRQTLQEDRRLLIRQFQFASSGKSSLMIIAIEYGSWPVEQAALQILRHRSPRRLAMTRGRIAVRNVSKGYRSRKKDVSLVVIASITRRRSSWAPGGRSV